MENFLIVYPLLRELEYLKQKEKEIQSKIDELPKGSVQKQNGHYYLKYYEDGKIKTKYLKDDEKDKLEWLLYDLKSRETLGRYLIDTRIAIKEFSHLVAKYGGKQYESIKDKNFGK